jgi:ArsR family transcriptional regulator, arsenate/arsenite/antimonite-responsive transcriptional repressor
MVLLQSEFQARAAYRELDLFSHSLMNIKLSKVQIYCSPHATLRFPMDIKDLARISKALSDPTRLRIYEDISACKGSEMFCRQVVENFSLTPGTVSHHLKILVDANLLETRREGQFMYLKSRPETVRNYTLALTKLVGKSTTKKRKAASDKADG